MDIQANILKSEISDKDIKLFNSKKHKFYNLKKYFKEHSKEFTFYPREEDIYIEVGECFFGRISLVCDVICIQYYWKEEKHLITYVDERALFLLKEILKHVNFNNTSNMKVNYLYLNDLIKDFSKRKYLFTEERVKKYTIDFHKALFFSMYDTKIKEDKILVEEINNVFNSLSKKNMFEDSNLELVASKNVNYINEIFNTRNIIYERFKKDFKNG